jgi:hypothetical protein
MDAGVVVFLIPIVAIISGTVLKLAKLRANRVSQTPSPDLMNRLEALEHDVQALQQELVDTQERLDFAERLLSKGREEKRVGGNP